MFLQPLLQQKSSITYSKSVCLQPYILSVKGEGAILSSVACLVLQYLSTLSHKGNDFLKKLLGIKCVFWFPLQLLYETFLILRRTEGDMIKNVYCSSCKVPNILVPF